MVRWYHSIFTAYGFWLPNDPRGTWSDFVAAWELYKFGGKATTIDTRRSVAHASHDRHFRQAAKQTLKYPPVRFDSQQRQCIIDGIGQACAESGITLLAGTIGYDHAHVVVARHVKPIEQVIGQFKGRATQAMRRAGCHPLQRFARGDETPPTPWAEKSWSVYINDREQLLAAIAYVERHAEKEGLPPQRWPCISAV